MVIPDYRRTTCPHRTMHINQSLRINLKMRVRRGVDIAGRDQACDTAISAQQYAAAFIRMRIGGLRHQIFDKPACDSQFHRAWPYHA